MFVDVSEQSTNPVFKIQAFQEECRATDGSVIIYGDAVGGDWLSWR
jgi:hypothetical protein